MIELRERKLGALRDWLANHVNPQRRFFNASYYAMATSILDLIDEVEISDMERQHEMSLETYEGQNA